MHRLGVAVLCVLNQEDHQEGDDRRTGIDDQLPDVGKMKGRSGQRPDDDDQNGAAKSPRASQDHGRTAREYPKRIANEAKNIALSFVLFKFFSLSSVH